MQSNTLVILWKLKIAQNSEIYLMFYFQTEIYIYTSLLACILTYTLEATGYLWGFRNRRRCANNYTIFMKYTIYTYPLYSHSLYNWCLCDCRERIRAKDLPVEDRVFIMKPDVPSAYAERSKSHMERKDPLQTQFVASRAITVT